MPDDQRPSIVFILLDQMRWDCMSCVGHPVVETPNFDEIAHRGVLFTAAYSSCPSCIAARASMMTGLCPSSHHRLGYQDRVPWRYEHMLPQVLGDAGYQTCCIGKTHFYPQRSHCGFQILETYECRQNHSGTYVNDYDVWLRQQANGRLEEQHHGLSSNSWTARPSPLPEELHNNSWVATRGIDFLRRRDPTRPFFLNLSFHRPHPPIDPPQAFWDEYRDRPLPPVPVGDWAGVHDVAVTSLDTWRGRLSDEALLRARRGYYAQVAHIDSQIGRVLLEVRRAGHGPTAFIVTSDHGEMLGDHHLWRKSYAYEGSAAVPMIVSVPGGVHNEVCARPTVVEDVYPTMLEIAGAPVPPGRDGHSLLSCAHGEAPPDWPDFVHGEHAECYDPANAMQFLTDGREKYVWFPVTGAEQFFDLTCDPQETRDLARDPANERRIAPWRQRLIERLATRQQDGLCDGEKLIAGQSTPHVRDMLLKS
jgi:arylsulfatase A-like enzyme